MIWFDRAAARELTATLELRVRFGSRPRSIPFALRIEQGRLRIRPGAPDGAAATATVGAGDLLALGLGRAAWPQLMSSGHLELSGDPFLALRFPTLFRLPV